MSKNKKIIYGIAAICAMIIAVVIIYKIAPPGAGPLLPSEEKLKTCSQDDDCLIVETINGLDYFPQANETCGCLCVTAINEKYKTLWEEKKANTDPVTECDIICKPCGFDLTNSQAKCENNDCVVTAKQTIQTRCVEEGGFIRGVEKQPTCCNGLLKIYDEYAYHYPHYGDDCELMPTPRNFTCTYCGNGICGEGETKCNCPSDCQ